MRYIVFHDINFHLLQDPRLLKEVGDLNHWVSFPIVRTSHRLSQNLSGSKS